ncbi:response regulator [Paenibacillus sp. FSL M7-1455]|uniref:Response regulatory protein n=1 Tax=Paenibacillus cookii TaxID=157839 RepID=A0ABQ4LQ30_9BACL|nr:response regulator [Paenibacillus cookii]GIO65379.1 putative response regulatory protein [Paenibacillus cookii]
MILNVMLVDDEAPILNNLKSIIPWKEMNMQVLAARSGKEALELFDIHNPDIILCDIRMPVMDGLTLIGELRERGSKAEIILLTGYQEFEYARAGIKYKVRDYICKPIHYKELENTIRAVGEQIVQQRLKDPFQQTVSRIEETEGQQSARKNPQQLMAEAVAYIASKLDTDLGIEELAGHLGISCSYFSLLFKNHLGMTFVEYVTGKRIEAAKYLLLHSDKSITQIGAGIGYHERRYFTKVFQRHTGMTPSEFRDQARSIPMG